MPGTGAATTIVARVLHFSLATDDADLSQRETLRSDTAPLLMLPVSFRRREFWLPSPHRFLNEILSLRSDLYAKYFRENPA